MKELIAEILHKKTKLSEEEIKNLIEIPPSSEFGDYSFPCFVLSKKEKRAPDKIATSLAQEIKLPKEIERVEDNGPYLNFFLNKQKIAQKIIEEIFEKKDKFGSVDFGKGKKALIEHTSINPNASPHVGRSRNALLGDSIVKILKFFNYKPEVHYYVNDVSKQIAMLVLANADKLKFEEMLQKYVEISKKVADSEKLEKEVFSILYKFEKGDKEIVKKFRKITKTCVEGQVKIFSKMNIHYDSFDYESEYMDKSKKILSELKKTGKLFEDKDGREVLDLKGTSVEGKMKSPVLVLTRNDGTGLYPLRDIAYTIAKLKIAPEENIVVLGEDQKLYFQQISEALKLLNSKSPKVIHYSFILLANQGKSRKMSTRKGDIVLLEDFLDEAISKAKKEIEKRNTKGDAKKIGIGAVKYAILKNASNKAILFNLEDALSFDGDTGPYILYSYARASSILKKIKKKSKEIIVENLESKEFELAKKLAQFKEIVLSAYNHLSPSLIANYSFELAQLFNEFYHTCPVIGNKSESFRIALVDAFRIVLKNSLNLLGIEVLEEM